MGVSGAREAENNACLPGFQAVYAFTRLARLNLTIPPRVLSVILSEQQLHAILGVALARLLDDVAVVVDELALLALDEALVEGREDAVLREELNLAAVAARGEEGSRDEAAASVANVVEEEEGEQMQARTFCPLPLTPRILGTRSFATSSGCAASTPKGNLRSSGVESSRSRSVKT